MMLKKFGKKLQEFRESLGFKQIPFAKRLRISQGMLSQLENGNTQPTVALLVKICKEFNTSLNYWIEELQPPQKSTPANKIKNTISKQIVANMQLIGREQKMSIAVLAAQTGIYQERLESILKENSEPTLTECVDFISAFPAYNPSWFFLNKGADKISTEKAQVELLARQSQEALQWIERIAENSAKLAAEKS